MLSSIGVRFISVFLGVHLGLALFNKEWRKSFSALFRNKAIGEKIRDGVISALRWAGPLSLTGGYFTYFTVFRFLEQNFTDVRFGILNLLMRSVFDLTILTFCVGMWLSLTTGFAFGEKQKFEKQFTISTYVI